MRLRWFVAALSSATVILSGCSNGTPPKDGLRLPEGDVEAGKVAFVDLGCVRCHSVQGEDDLPAPTGPVQMELGGQLFHVSSYGQLVTAIVHPSHSISGRAPEGVREAGTTPMENINETMTVAQMIDLVAFLHSKYVLLGQKYNPVPF